MLAFFVISTHLGGAERSLLDLIKVFKDTGVPFKVVVPKSTGPLIDQMDQAGIDWILLPFPQWLLMISRRRWDHFVILLPLIAVYLPIYFWRLHRFIISYDIQKIHSTGLKYHLLLGFYGFLFRRPVLTLHLRDVIHSRLLQKVFRLISRAPNISWVANSQATARSIAPISCPVIYNGLPVLPNSTSLLNRTDFHLPEQRFLVGVVGAIARWKGQREFLLMAHKLVELGYDFHFVIVGEEIYDTEGDQGEMAILQKYVHDFNLTDRVSFLGFQKNPQDIYRLLDVLVHSSIEPEPFGRVIVEAMQVGCPVTASAQGGPLEIIEPGQNGLLHEPANIQSMTEQVLYYYNHPEARQKMAQTALTKLAEFSMDTHVHKMSKALKLTQ